MILRSIRAAGYRCFAGPVFFEIPDDCNLVLSGPNGSGKSTLLEAAVRALIDSHAAGGEDVRRLQPWRTSLAPTVSVEFECGGLYRITKTFLHQAGSLLEQRQADGTYARVAQGKSADARVREMLSADSPARGLSRVEHCGVLRILMSPQGRLETGELKGKLLDNVRRILGASLAGPAGIAFEERLANHYYKSFTPTGRPKRGRLHELAAKLEAARDQLAAAREPFERIAAAENDAEAAGRRLAEVELRLSAIGPELEKLQRQDAERGKLLTRQELEAQKEQAARLRYEEIANRVRRIRELRRDRLLLEEKQADSRRSLAAETGREAAAEQAFKAAESAYESAKTPDPEVARAEELAGLAREWLDLSSESAALAARRERLGAIAAKLQGLDGKLAALRAPSPAELKEIRKTRQALEDAGTKLDASLLKLALRPDTDSRVEVLEGEPPGELAAAAGQALALTGEGRIRVHIPGFGIVEAAGPDIDLSGLKRRHESARERLRQLTAPFGVDGIAELETRAEERSRLEQAKRGFEVERDVLLAGDSADGLAGRWERLSAGLSEIARQQPEWKDNSPVAAELQKEAARRRTEFEARRSAAHDLLRQASEEHARRRLDKAAAEQRLAAVSEKLVSVRKSLAELETDGQSDEERTAAATEFLADFETARRALAETQALLAALPDDAGGRLEELRSERDALGRERAALERRIRDAETTKRALLEGAPYQKLSSAEERVEELEREHRKETRRLDSLRLLWTTVTRVREEALAGIVTPVAEEATRLLEEIAGSPLARLELTGGLAIGSVESAAAGTEVTLDEFSGGETEQIHLAARLALAKLLSTQERQAMVLDDALLNTDGERLRRIFAILERLSARIQFIALTCHPERYRKLPNARAFRLEGGQIQTA